MDIVEETISKNRIDHPEKFYLHHDILEFPGNFTFDLIICRALLQHLTLDTGIKIAKKLISMSKYIFFTTFLTGSNREIHDGSHYFINMFLPPFCFSEPLVLFPDFNLARGDKNLMYAGIWRTDKLKTCLDKVMNVTKT